MANHAPIRLLVVVHDGHQRTLLRRRFTRIGYEVMEAHEAAKALQLVAMIPFDLLLLEVAPPALDGLEVLRRARETRPRSELAVMMLAGGASGDDAVEALALGADDCLAKPVDVEVVFARAEMLMRRRRAEKKAPPSPRLPLETALGGLQDAVGRLENAAARLPDLGADERAPLGGVLGAASVLTRLCDGPELESVVGLVQAQAGVLEALLSAALDSGERRDRTPRGTIRVLSADDDARTRFGLTAMLDAAQAEVELTEVGAGLQAALACESRFFDLIVINIATPEAVAGVRAIRRAERRNRSRRTPILILAPNGEAASEAMQAGADLHMSHPVTAEGLLTALAAGIARQSLDLSTVA